MKKFIAERKLIVEVKKTGERKEIYFRIGEPYWLPDDELAACPRELDGLFEQVADARGVDLLQAIQLAADIDTLLRALGSKYNFYWPSGDGYFDDH